MGIYALGYQELNGETVATWVNDDSRLLDTPQDKVGKIKNIWPNDIHLKLQDGGVACDVLHSPSALICLPSGKQKIEQQRDVNELIEWLPVTVETLGTCFVCHPHAFLPFQPKSLVHRASHTGNVTAIKKLIIEDGVTVPPIFLIASPLDSKAGMAGYGLGRIYVSELGKRAFSGLSGIEVRPLERYQS